MSIKNLQNYTYYSKYARYLESEKRRETWVEAVDRVMDMHLRKYPNMKEEIEWVRPLVKEKRVLGSQRALQYGGEPIEKKNARMFNCIAGYCDRVRFFQESFWLLLAGCGVGFSVQKHHVAKLPKFLSNRKDEIKTYVIPDTIEGWADSLGVLLASYFPSEEFKEYEGYTIKFDFSLIRPAGSLLSSGVGKAPGPEPLKLALIKINELLQRCIENEQSELRPIDAYDIVMHASDAVLSGGVRRSACLTIFSLDDDEMIKAKTGNWFYENPQRARSNNSVLLLRDEVTKEQFLSLMESVKQFGEPGFIWSDDKECLFNPCCEISLYAYDKDGNSGFQSCNLSEINGKKIKTIEDFEIAAKAAAILGTLQAGYTDFDYLGSVSENIIEREALLGVSITGMMDSPDIIFDPDNQKKMAKLIVRINKEIAKKIGINPAARCTCVKPAGSTSCILGSASGIHPHHAKRYFRRIQGNKLETVLAYFKQFNPHAIEKSVWSANKTDEVITFCVDVPPGAKVKNDLSAIELLEYVKLTQQNWVTYGKDESLCTQTWLNHNVSNTINVREDEWDGVAEYIYKNRKYFAGISLLPASGDLDYPQAPMVNVLNHKEILAEYGEGALFASGLIVDGLHAFDDLWEACDIVLDRKEFKEPILDESILNLEDSPIVQMEHAQKLYDWKQKHAKWDLQVDWIRRVKQFAQRYCDNDVMKCTRLMKHVHNWKLWIDLTREYQDVDYSNFYEETNNTKLNETIACAGGKCDLM